MIKIGFGKTKELSAWQGDANLIEDGLFLGGFGAANSEQFVKTNKINSIVSLNGIPESETSKCMKSPESQGKFKDVQYLEIWADDVDE